MQRPNDNKMHPEDMRNLFIFFILAAVLYIGYNSYILKPQSEALKAAQQVEAQKIAQNPAAADAQKPLPRAQALATTNTQETRIQIDNGVIFGSISTKGVRLDDIALYEYFDTLEKKDNVVVLSPSRGAFPRYLEYGWVSSDKAIKVPTDQTVWTILGNNKLTKDTPVTLAWNNGAGLIFEHKLEMDDEYLFTVTQSVSNNSGKEVTLYPYGLVNQKGVPPYFASTWISHEGPIGYVGEDLHQISYKKLRKEKTQSYSADQGWLGITDKYWLTALIPPQGEAVKYRFNFAGTRKDRGNTGKYQSDFLGAAVTLTNGQGKTVTSNAFIGAKKVLQLQQYEKDLDIPKFDLAVDFGMLWFMSKPFFWLLHHANEIVGNFGVAIIILTVLIRGAVFPLTNLSYRSFAKMKKVSPQIAELRDKHANDKQKLQMELMQMYQREGVNPMAGCFPILLQIPIFFALYKTLFVTIEMRHAPFFGWIKDLSVADPTSVFNLFGLIPWDPPSILNIGVWPCVMLLAMIVQKKLNPPPQDKIQRDIANYMPYMFALIMAKFAAGLVVYWSFSAIIGILQQIFIMKSLNVPIHLFGETDDEKKMKEVADDGSAPLGELVEEDVEQSVSDGDDAPPPPKKISPPKPKKSKKKKK